VSQTIGCESPRAEIVVTVNALPTAPIVSLTQPSCTLGSGTITVTVQTPGETYSFDNGATFQSGNSLSGMAPGTYSVVIKSIGGCNSVATSVTINAQPESPAIPAETTDCAAGPGFASVIVTSPISADLEYRLDAGPYQAGTTFTNVANGSHTITVLNTVTGCATPGPSFTVSCGCPNGPALALGSISGSTCGISPVTVSGNTFSGSATSVTITSSGSGTVTPASGSSPFDFTYTPSTADEGTTVIITVTTDNPLGVPCAAASATYTLTVNAVPVIPTVSVIQPTCEGPTGTITITAPTGLGMTYSIDGIAYTNTTGVFALLGPGVYSVTARNAAGCVSAETTVTLIAQLPLPITGTIIQPPSCAAPTGSVSLSGLPSTGTWTINPGAIAGTGTSTTITDLIPGTYNFNITSEAGCTSLATANVVINPAPEAPPAPIAGTITQPSSCAAPTGSVDLSGLPAAGTWVINPGSIAGTGTTTTITNLIPGSYNFYVTSEAGCISLASSTVVINAAPIAPSAPIPGTITQPSSCAAPTGSVVLNGLPATGTWTLNPGSIAGTGTTTTLTNLSPGTYNFNVTSEAGCISVESGSVIINPAPVAPTAPIIGTITQPSSCIATTGNVVLNGLPATGTWIINPGAIAGTGTSVTISNLTPGTYNFNVTSDAGCISHSSADVIINVAPPAPTAPIVGTITQPSSCSAPTGSVVLTGLPVTGAWVINPGGITGTGTSTTITNLAPGTYNFTIYSDPGCISHASADIVINPAPVAPTAPIVGTITQPSSCSAPTGSVVLNGLPATGSWTINPGAITGTGTSTTIPSLIPGTYNFSVTAAAGCISHASADIVINAAPVAPTAPIAGTVTQPSSCAESTGSVVLNGLPATGTWTINPGAITGTGTSTTIINLIPGTYKFNITSDAGCISLPSTDVVINDAPGGPLAPIAGTITQPSSCAVPKGSVDLSGLPATGTWVINPGSIAGTGTTTTITNLIPGSYNFYVTSEAGCISLASATVVINAAPVAPSAPIIGTITQPSSCAAPTGSVVLNGLPATGTWTINPGSIAGTGTTTTLTNLRPGTYNFNVTSEAGCISVVSASVVINPAPVAPTAPIIGTITQPSSCTSPTGSVVLNGLPATGIWVINPGSIAGTGTSVTISNLTPGTYNFNVTSAAGCISRISADVIIHVAPSAPTAPIVGTITQPSSCSAPTGSVILTGLPATGTWTINPGGITGTGTSTTILNLAPGTYNFTIYSDPGCISHASADIVINAAPVAPTAPIVGTITQPSSCSATTGSVVLNGLPSTGTWIINPGAITGTGTSTTIPNLIPGTYNLSVTAAAGCISHASADIVINAAPVAPTAPIAGTVTQPSLCASPTGTVVLNGLPATGTWTINPGAITGTGTSTTITNLIPGTYKFNITSAAGCISLPSTDVVIISPPGTPATPVIGIITQPSSCTSVTGNVVLNGLPATGTWTINPGAITGTGTTTTIANLIPGSYKFTVTIASGCTSLASSTVVIETPSGTPAAPVAGTITQPTCAVATGSVILTGLPAGNWTINPGAIAGTGASTTISGLAIGTYNYTVTGDAGCTSPVSSDVVIIAFPGAPTAPVIGTVTQPTCADATGSIILTGLPSGNWTVNPGEITGSGGSTTISGLTAGTYNFTVTNSIGCLSPVSPDVIITAFPGAPVAPTAGTITQPTCTVATGSVILNGLPAGVWAINPGAITGTGSSATITGLAVGTYKFTVTNDAGCISPVSANVVINSVQAELAAPLAELSDYNGFNISCYAKSDGFITITPSGDFAPYTFSWSGPDSFTSSTKDISGLKAGQYTVSITDVNSCTSIATFELTQPRQLSMIIDRSTSSDGAYNINCAGANTGFAGVTAINNVGPVNYLWSDGFIGNLRTTIPAGIYKIILTDSNNCNADSTITLTAPDSIKLTFDVTEPFCPKNSDGEVQLTVTGGLPGSDYTYKWSDNSTSQNISNINQGLYIVTVGDMNGCSITDSIQVNSKNATCLIIPNAFSPNGDLINDVWNIGHIEEFPLAEVIIFNNWGVTVWKSEQGYPHPWDGRSNGIMLPIDSYFYIIDLHNGSKPIAGSVTIIK
jgi:gliding motility-associated-like protein